MARGRFAAGDDQDEAPDEQQDRIARAFAAAGLRIDGPIRRPDAGREDFHLWPECVETWRLWCAVQTQWRVGFAGATGLDYGAVLALIDRRHRRPARRREAFEAIREMERAALEAWAEQRDEKR